MHPVRQTQLTPYFTRWLGGLDAERSRAVTGAVDRLVAGGPTLGRPFVDRIHGSSVHKLKEVRVPSGIRLLFAFDSNRDLVMLVGGDKTGKWNRWYPPMIRLAERLYVDHERSIGKEARCLTQRDAGRTSGRMSR